MRGRPEHVTFCIRGGPMSPHVPRLLALSVALAFVVGCGAEPNAARIHREGGPQNAAEAPAGGAKGGEQAKYGANPPADAAAKVPPAERNIIYTANLDVVVTDWDTARPEVDRLI